MIKADTALIWVYGYEEGGEGVLKTIGAQSYIPFPKGIFYSLNG